MACVGAAAARSWSPGAADRPCPAQPPRAPTAVHARSDEVALGAIRTLRRAGLRIPEDISVIGIDDHPVAEPTDLTTVRRPVREEGELAGRMLLSIPRGEETDHDVVVPTQLVIRGSTAPPRS
ncbi:substrate-binding domain-containing protein [Streptomyces ipomoeae]|uniref:substrate-binding domain-containing protein n=1 Tax=Streptomyces ipomoeae TaxID=103232 RepID=UPI001FD5D056|nr:substrate-binding domain-containing protein [Streptomyces ipomoeae]MDX2935210.1 substrate-binding domain-containing protein [Streptomyces ipomoeae]